MSFATLTKFAVLAAAAMPALAHMKMLVPEQYDVNGSNALDPLTPTGAFPCQGNIGKGGAATGTLNAGSSFHVELGGSAVHGGGSCQFSLSYDGGNTWGVIHEIIGNCPTENEKFDVPIPAGLPSAQGVIFAWTWFNRVGNREMYMKCATVDVLGASGSIELPRMFEANIPGKDGCKTPDSTDVDFNNPVLDNCSDVITHDQKVTLGSGAPSTPTTPPTGGNTTTPPTGGDDPCPPEGGETTTPPTGSTPPTTGGGNTWDASKVYVGGDSACYNGQKYTAKWWTQGNTPGSDDVWGSPAGAC